MSQEDWRIRENQEILEILQEEDIAKLYHRYRHDQRMGDTTEQDNGCPETRNPKTLAGSGSRWSEGGEGHQMDRD